MYRVTGKCRRYGAIRCPTKKKRPRVCRISYAPLIKRDKYSTSIFENNNEKIPKIEKLRYALTRAVSGREFVCKMTIIKTLGFRDVNFYFRVCSAFRPFIRVYVINTLISLPFIPLTRSYYTFRENSEHKWKTETLFRTKSIHTHTQIANDRNPKTFFEYLLRPPYYNITRRQNVQTTLWPPWRLRYKNRNFMFINCFTTYRGVSNERQWTHKFGQLLGKRRYFQFARPRCLINSTRINFTHRANFLRRYKKTDKGLKKTVIT